MRLPGCELPVCKPLFTRWLAVNVDQLTSATDCRGNTRVKPSFRFARANVMQGEGRDYGIAGGNFATRERVADEIRTWNALGCCLKHFRIRIYANNLCSGNMPATPG
jgi:hypothetical protein